MRARKLSRPGRILVYLMSFLMAFSSASTFCIQAVQAAVETVQVQGDAMLRGMLALSTAVSEEALQAEGVQEAISQRDMMALEYARENGILGTYTKSESLGSDSEDGALWYGNVLYEGDILRSGDFDGYSVYFDGADSKVIMEGINEIDVTIVPSSGGGHSISSNGIDNDINSWDRHGFFASRFMLPNLGNTSDTSLRNGWAYHTKMYVVGINYGKGLRNPVYSQEKMNYLEYLDYTKGTSAPENMQSYVDYLSFFKDFDQNVTKNWNNSLNEWQEMSQIVSGRKGPADQPRIEDTADVKPAEERREEPQGEPSHGPTVPERRPSNPGRQPVNPEPPTEEPEEPEDPDIQKDDFETTYGSIRTMMVYMDASSGLTDAAVVDLKDMLLNSYSTADLGDARLLVLTGGAYINDWSDSMKNELTTDLPLYQKDGKTAAHFDHKNQLWELRGGKMLLIDNDFAKDHSMTDVYTLRNFLKASQYLYPTQADENSADKNMYDLFIWGHGGGPTGFGSDDNGVIDLGELASALKDSNVPLDLITFDACYMGNTDVAMAVAPYATYMIASEQNMDLSGQNGGKGLRYKWMDDSDISTIYNKQTYFTG
ncbi:MAG: hypothetical protein K6G42_10475, partial [Lachnospiraceae bacterium]|nr:hypothetical protein [Lachnospiraceae bacterium]